MTRKRIIIALGLVLLMALVAIPVAAQGYPDPGTGSTVTELANKTANAAQANLFYYDQNGNVIAGPQKNIAGNGSTVIDAAGSQLPQGFNGAGVASSNQPLAAVVETDWTGGPGDGFQMGYYSGVSEGSGKICFPSLWKFSGANSIISSMAVQNTGTSSVAVAIEYVGRDGVSQGTRNDNIPVGAQHTYDLATPSATVPNIPDGWEGSAIVTVNGAGSVAGVGVTSWGGVDVTRGRSSTYNASDCDTASAASIGATTVLVAPTAFRVRPGGGWTGGIWSAVNVQNLSGNTANVELDFVPRDNADPGVTLNTTIPPRAAIGANTRNGGSFPASAFDPLNSVEDWSGAVKITVDQDAAGTVITQWDRGGLLEAGIYTLANEAGGATKIFTPNVKRINPGTWQKWSAVIVQNLGGSAADVTVAFYNRSGTKVLEFANDSIGVGASLGYNTRNGGDKPASAFDPLGTSFEGHVVVTSNNGQPLAVVLNGITRSPGSGSATTNGIPE
ncbi:MAG: hypothetical protein J5I90_16310 [Caldilineales bacterium]|nr:hypothetical protein [Caldilineales bacterium]